MGDNKNIFRKNCGFISISVFGFCNYVMDLFSILFFVLVLGHYQYFHSLYRKFSYYIQLTMPAPRCTYRCLLNGLGGVSASPLFHLRVETDTVFKTLCSVRILEDRQSPETRNPKRLSERYV